MTKYALSLNAQKIVRSLVKALEHQEERVFFWNPTQLLIRFPSHVDADPIRASSNEVHAIESHGLLRLDNAPGGTITGRLEDKAIHAVSTSFGHGRRRIVLAAVSELTERNQRRGVTWDEIVEKTGLSYDEVDTYAKNLIRDGLLDRVESGQGAHLTRQGIAAVEEADHPLAQPSTSSDASGVYTAVPGHGSAASVPSRPVPMPAGRTIALAPAAATSTQATGGVLQWIKGAAWPWRKRV